MALLIMIAVLLAYTVESPIHPDIIEKDWTHVDSVTILFGPHRYIMKQAYRNDTQNHENMDVALFVSVCIVNDQCYVAGYSILFADDKVQIYCYSPEENAYKRCFEDQPDKIELYRENMKKYRKEEVPDEESPSDPSNLEIIGCRMFMDENIRACG